MIVDITQKNPEKSNEWCLRKIPNRNTDIQPNRETDEKTCTGEGETIRKTNHKTQIIYHGIFMVSVNTSLHIET